MAEPYALEGFWTLACKCGATITMIGKIIIDSRGIICPNCARQPNLHNLQETVKSLASFQIAIDRATGEEAGAVNWRKITPPVEPF